MLAEGVSRPMHASQRYTATTAPSVVGERCSGNQETGCVAVKGAPDPDPFPYASYRNTSGEILTKDDRSRKDHVFCPLQIRRILVFYPEHLVNQIVSANLAEILKW